MKTKYNARIAFKVMVATIGVAGALVYSSVGAQATSIQSHVNAVEDGAVTMVIQKGNNVRDIAKKYSRTHNVPFNQTLEKLIAANPNAFAGGNPDVLIIGSKFVLPSKTDLLGQAKTQDVQVKPKASGSESASVAPQAASVTMVTESPLKIESTPSDSKTTTEAAVVSTPVATEALSQTSAVVSDAESKTLTPALTDLSSVSKLTWDTMIAVPVWAVVALVVVLLILLASLVYRWSRNTKTVLSEDTKNDRSNMSLADENGNQISMIATQPRVDVKLAGNNLKTELSTERNEQKEEVSSVVESLVAQTESVVQSESGITQSAQDVKTNLPFSFPYLNTAKYGLPVAILPVRSDEDETVDLTTAVKTPQTTEHKSSVDETHLQPKKHDEQAENHPEIDASTTSFSSGLDLDVTGFMNRYVNPALQQAPTKPSFNLLDFESMLDPTYLQSWMNQNTPEAVLTRAQEAHDAGYDQIAERMLADVLFRGDAEQCTLAAQLRKKWLSHGYV
ncbi:type IV pilus assembly protein FimV [Hydromonas duriensis]|uniref:FimV-like protein n=1 Tax=Hydromonas duriensis TaxID=1527608 RepID=A0A4R6Y8X0_9BURK|nr:hypothetical protein [Hydromonas duriensis]TDR31867.1 hypothetical protein DFR44_10784 [Hydromonas duriensis]